jgi:hypothetical protein
MPDASVAHAIMSAVADQLQSAKWTTYESRPVTNPDMPRATHEATLWVFEKRLRCYRLDKGQQVFDANDVHDLLGVSFEEMARLANA